MTKPIVLIPANIIDYTGLPAHAVRDTYINAVADLAGCTPLILPAIGDKADFRDLAAKAGGVLLTGSPSNLNPAHYGEERMFDEKSLDLARDATTLPLIRQAIEMDIPLLAICRGFQELNIVMRGTLVQKIQEQPGKMDHRDPTGMPLQEAFERQAHKVTLEPGGLLQKIGLPPEFTVNSLHEQGLGKLGDGLKVEAIAEDGVVEAVSLPGKRFILAVQWHPEADPHVNPASGKILKAFGEIVRDGT